MICVTFTPMSGHVVSLLEAAAADLARKPVGALGVVFPHVPVQGRLLTAGEAAHLALQWFLSCVDSAMDAQVAAGAEGTSAEFTDEVSLIAVQLLVLLQVLLVVKGFSTGRMRASEGLLLEVLVLHVVVEVLTAGKDLPAAFKLAG